MKTTPRFLVLLLACLGLIISPMISAAADVLNNHSVIEMQKMDLGDAVIIEKIKKSQCNFDTSMDGLKSLKDANVSSAVIAAMVAAPVAAASASSGNINDPKAQHTAGIWVMVSANGKNQMTQLPSETPAEITHGGFIGPWGIGKRATTARLTGMESKVQLSQAKPVFYLYMKTSGMELAGATTPSEITLAQFTVLGKDDKHNPNQRAVDVAIHGAYSSSYGVDHKAVRKFETTQVADGIYKLVPKEDLANGEYAFCAGANTAAMTGQYQYFTFGIHTK